MKLPVFQTSNWVAWEVDLFPTNLNVLLVKGDITLPTPGYAVTLNEAVPQGINPSQLILQLFIQKIPGIFPQVETTFPAFFSDTSSVNYDSVLIQLPDGNTITVDIQKNVPKSEFDDLTITFIPPLENLDQIQSAASEVGEGLVYEQNGLLFFARYEKKLKGGIRWIESETDFSVFPPKVSIFPYKGDLWVTVDHPRINEITGAIGDCLKGAAVVAAITAIVAGVVSGGGAIPGTAVATFETALKACLTSKGVNFANQIKVNLEIRNRRTA